VRLAATAATSATLKTGMASMGSIIPIIPFEMDSCTRREVADSATIIRTIAPRRSDHGARLKNSHHRTMISAPAKAPSTP
jgi:hypothetical protein